MSNPQVAIDITANDRSAKGFNSAEKRAQKLGGDVAKIGNASGLGNLSRTFLEVDKAAAKAFGNRSALGTIGEKAAAFRGIGSAMGSGLGRSSIAMARAERASAGAAASLTETAAAAAGAEAGMGEAAAAAGGLAVAMGPVAVVGAAVVATLGAAAVAGYKFSSSWAAGTAQMGRLAQTIGVSAQALQQFEGAAARYGIGKDAADQTLSGFAQNVHDARYGRNNETLALMHRLGVQFRYGSDGNLDYTNMLSDAADALKRQKDPQTALMIANRLGIANALPLLRGGRGAVASEMGDVARHGVNLSDRQISDAQQFTRDSVIMGQMMDRKKQGAQASVAGKYVPALDEGVKLGRSAFDGTLGSSAAAIGAGASRFMESVSADFAPAAKTIGAAADKMLAASQAPAAAGIGAGAPGGSLAGRIEHLGERSRQDQVSPKGAVGVMQVMPATARTQAARMGIAFDEHRYRTDPEYNRKIGRSYLDWLQRRFGDDVLATAAYNAGEGRVDGWLKTIGDPRKGGISDAEFARRIPIRETRDYVARVDYGVTPSQQHHHTHEIHVHPGSVSVKTTTRGSNALAVSHAPVGG